MQDRNVFLKYFFEKISTLNYAVLRFAATTLHEYNDENIMLLISKSQYKKVLEAVGASPQIKSLSLIEKPYYGCVIITFNDGFVFELNVITNLVRKGIFIMDEKEVLRYAVKNELGIKVASPTYHFEYTLLSHLLNGLSVPDAYKEHFAKYDRETRSRIFGHIRGRYYLEMNVLDDLYDYSHKTHSKILDKILSRKENKLRRRFLRGLNYLPYIFLNLVSKHRIKVTFNPKLYPAGTFTDAGRARAY